MLTVRKLPNRSVYRVRMDKQNFYDFKTRTEAFEFAQRQSIPTKRHSMPPRNKKNFRPTDQGAGMTEAGVKAYRRQNPGSNLQTAVTSKHPTGKDKARKRSFCARSIHWNGPRGLAARRRWNC